MLKAIALMALLASPAFAAETCRGFPMPPLDKRAEPTVPYKVRHIPRSVIAKYCGAPNHPYPAACSFPNPKRTNAWIILIGSDLAPGDVPCVTIYEKSHLPPNNWVDQAVEHDYHYNPS